MTKILALSGKKQSGKNSAFNFILGTQMLDLSIVRNKVELADDGRLYISDLFGNEKVSGVFDIDSPTQTVKQFNEEYLYPYIRNYSFADLLKRKIGMEVLGLSFESMYGTDAQKKAPTHLRWENMPGVTTEKTPQDPVESEVAGRLGKYYEKVLSGVIYHEPGPMTGRDVMQYIGTEIFRKMYPTVWADGTIRRIQEDASDFAIITDTRFPDEVEAAQKAGGKVMRLTRNPFPEDQHPSETALDEDKFDWSKFDAVIDNRELSLPETSKLIYEKLREWGWIGPINL